MPEETVLEQFKNTYEATKSERMSLQDYLDLCRTDKLAYASPAERMLAAIGDPVSVDTSKTQRLSRLFGNRVIKTYPAFRDFYGMEDTIESLVNYFRHSAQGLEESKQLLYLLGPVGGGKSSLVDRLKELIEKLPVYVLAYEAEDEKGKKQLIHSPYFARPLALFNRVGLRESIHRKFQIEARYLKGIIGPWEAKRLREFNGDIAKFKVVRLYPSALNQIAITNTEPGDENTQDVSTLVGKIDIRKLEVYSQNDPDAYSFSGGLNVSNQGVLDFREMFKAKIKMLNPLLFAVQEHVYNGTENFGAIPYDGIVLAHSNESEWQKFRTNKDNEAFLDRICIVRVPYCLRVDEEVAIYKKSISGSDMEKMPIAPGTMEMMAQFSVLTRLREQENSPLYSKMMVYNGKNMKEEEPKAKTYLEYRNDIDNRPEGFSGSSTRWAFKRLSQTFNSDPTEIAANPVHLMRILHEEIGKADLLPDTEKCYKDFVIAILRPKYFEFLDKEIRTAYLESYADYGQNLFDRYVMWAEKWISDEEWYDSNSGATLNKDSLNTELEKIEKASDFIANPKDFRNEVIRYVMRYSREHEGKNPDWRSYEKLRIVIEKKMFSQTEDLLPVISFTPKGTEEEKKKHSEFIDRMVNRGYTPQQVRILIDWFIQVRKTT